MDQPVSNRTGIKRNQGFHKNRNLDQWNKIESPKITHAPMGTLFFTKEARIYSGTKKASSISGAGKTEDLCFKKMK